ncbi:MAG: class I SAM-dependent methyltransferase [Alphaproteobacteria bacterium]|nr:class I SAM-dependent methyltransferase [Alphaproteobacteria bacterium]
MSEREERASEIMVGALDAVALEGRVLAVGVADDVVRALGATGLEVTRWDRWATGGREASALPPEGPYDRVCMRLPKGRDTLSAMLALAAAELVPEGKLWLYGANDEGIRSVSKQLRDSFDHDESVDARRHCRVVQASGVHAPRVSLRDFRTEVEATAGGRTFRFTTLPGVFAHGRLDEGTRLLLENLSVDAAAKLLDFGCGAGVVAAFLGERLGPTAGVDIDAWAIECAQAQPGTWVVGDGLAAAPEGLYDHIVSNPPFHTGKDTDFHVMDALITSAPSRLVKGGRLTFVCPSTAPVKRALDAAFSKVVLLADDRRYRVWEAR